MAVAGIEGSFEIGMVLAGERGKSEHGVGQADAFSRRQLAADLDAGERTLRRYLDRGEPDLAVIEQQGVAGLERGQDFRMGQVHPRLVPRGRVGIEDEIRTLGEKNGILLESADPQLRPLQVHQHPDRPAVCDLDVPDHAHEFAHAFVAGVAHIDAEHVGAGRKQGGDHLTARRGRTEGGNDLGAAPAPHRGGVPARRAAAWPFWHRGSIRTP
jgi:hypothetical protein